MKKPLYFCIFLLLSVCLSGCGVQKPDWPGYSGTMEGYEYCNTEQRDRAWEEDVLSLAENFLRYHPQLVNAETKMIVSETYIEWQNLFEEWLHSAFLAEINQLIPDIPELTDTQILFRLQKIVASLGDSHSRIALSTEPFFPVSFMPIHTDEGVELYAVVLPAEYEDFLYAKLISVNGVPVEEILNRMKPYISHENQYWLIHAWTVDSGGEWITQRDMLEQIGVIAADSTLANFEFRKENGQAETVGLEAVTLEEYIGLQKINHGIYKTYALLYKDWTKKNYWYQMLPEENALYVRIAWFYEDENQSLREMSEQMIRDIQEANGVDKFIVDLRNNGGGMEIEGYGRFFQALTLRNIGKVYVLIDGGTYSRAVIAAYRIRQDIDGAVLVGTPAGEGSTLFSHTEKSNYTMPNCGVEYFIGTQKCIIDPDSEYSALMPDILVYQTMDDYKSKRDTVLEYVLGLE